MNSFLLHLTKSRDDHAARMDESSSVGSPTLYVRPCPIGEDIWACVRRIPVLLRTWWPCHCLANQVHNVGERQQRYGVPIPEAKTGNKTATTLHGGNREAFLQDSAS